MNASTALVVRPVTGPSRPNPFEITKRIPFPILLFSASRILALNPVSLSFNSASESESVLPSQSRNARHSSESLIRSNVLASIFPSPILGEGRPAISRILSKRCSWLHDVVSLATMASFPPRSEEHTSELQSPVHLVCRL